MSLAPTDRDNVAPDDQLGEQRQAGRGAHILVVDDDAAARVALAALLRAEGFAISTASDGEAALAAAKLALPDVVLTDLQMQPMDGVELCRRFHEIDPELPVIVVTGFADMQSVIESLRAGAEDYLLKPVKCDTVLWCVNRALERRAAKIERDDLRRRTEELYRTLNERLVFSSVREQEYAEDEARQRAQLNALLENLSEGVAIAEQDGSISMINHAGRVILGYGDEELHTIDALHSLGVHDLAGRTLTSAERPLMRALRGEEFTDYEVLRIRPNGEQRRVVSTGTSVRGENGNVTLAILLFRDVTELRCLEKQRDEYLALISHDLRTPLSAILMSASMLAQSMKEGGPQQPLPAVSLKLAERAERNAMRMTAMLEELTETTTLESHGVEPRRVVCDLRELVVGVVDSLDDARAHRITIEMDDASPYVVLVEAVRLERVVANLLTNALKYSPEGAPVSARLSRKGSDVALDVVDRGIGIAPESVKLLFSRYYRTPAGKARASGLGLGLYIARLIAEGHGGRIDVSSEVGEGSRFRLTLPLHPASAEAS